jgi:hypothetical protein
MRAGIFLAIGRECGNILVLRRDEADDGAACRHGDLAGACRNEGQAIALDLFRLAPGLDGHGGPRVRQKQRIFVDLARPIEDRARPGF